MITSIIMTSVATDPHSITQPKWFVSTNGDDGVGRGIGEFKKRSEALQCVRDTALQYNVPWSRCYEEGR